MTKCVPLNKQSKKKQREFYSLKRNTWTVDPRTKVIPNKKHDYKKLPYNFGSFFLFGDHLI